MADATLKERLREHSEAFDSLLSLIPAKHYYGEDTSDQWKRKKQTKEQAKAARRGKLDPDSALNRNAKEVMEERARNKRKLQEVEEDETSNDEDEEDVIRGIEREKPREGLKKKKIDRDDATSKKQKLSEVAEQDDKDEVPEPLSKEEKKNLKKQKKTENIAAKLDKRAAQQSPADEGHSRRKKLVGTQNATDESEPVPSKEVGEEPEHQDDEMRDIEIAGLVVDGEDRSSLLPPRASRSSSSATSPDSPTFDTSHPIHNAEPASTTSSISSTIPPSEKPKHIKIPSDTTALRVRLAARIEALRAARKADGMDGRPIRTRQELIESRREKQAQRKAHKKELRRQAKEEEERKREEALVGARTSPGSVLSPLLSYGSPDDGSANHFAFGRVAFTDGAQMSHDLSYVKEGKDKRKGPSDPKTALAKLEAQKKRISGLDEDKRKEVLEKETWLAARRRAEGEKIKDDEGLLKKAVKRKEKTKKKSEREWKERKEGVEKSIKQRQHKREENLKKRRDEKLLGKAGKKKGAKGAKVKKGRPGFEGTFSVGAKRK